MAANFFSDYSRRDFMRMSLGGALGVSCSGWMEALANGADLTGRRRSCILLWMGGGPSQLDTFDMKPGTMYGGEFKEIATATPGMRISEHLPALARQSNDLAIIRSMTSKEGDHGRGAFLMRTGYAPQGTVRYPALGSVIAKELGQASCELPHFVSITPFFFGQNQDSAGYLGPSYGPLTVGSQGNNAFMPTTDESLTVQDLAPNANLSTRSATDRVDLLQFMHSEFDRRHPQRAAEAHRANYERAIKLAFSKSRSVFDLSSEPDKLRDAYGRNRFGQGCLLARRLVERGVPFVEVGLFSVPGANIGWDSHQQNFASVKALSQTLDPAWATLMEDLRSRGLLDSTLIVWMGEFGRTPQINIVGGRDHYPAAWSAVLAGGGIRGGQVIGNTGKLGLRVEDRPVTPPDLIATICQAMGIDPHKEFISDERRPIPIVDRGAKPIGELIA